MSAVVGSSEKAVPYVELSIITIATALVPIGINYFKAYVEKIPWLYRLAWGLAFLLNVATVSIPGRFDDQQSNGNKGIASWKTVFAPAPYAFAIWGVIYLGELLLTIYSGLIGTPVQALRRASTFWIAGNMFQSLWCSCFRPKFRSALWLPSTHLALAALSFYMVNAAIFSGLNKSHFFSQENMLLLVLRAPIALHAGWLSAATLLNLNAWASVSLLPIGKQIGLAFASSYFAFAVGVIMTFWLADPLIPLTLAWALEAVAYETRTNCQVNLSQETKEALFFTEGFLAKALIGTAVFVPLARSKLF